MDLEDAVAPGDKEAARKNVIAALHDVDWATRGKTVSVRINGLDTQYMYRDVVEVMELAGDRLHTASRCPKSDTCSTRPRFDRRSGQVRTENAFRVVAGSRFKTFVAWSSATCWATRRASWSK
ncbi:aldolase/citrate lyase family protein [Amycolatopsis alkalitolerans]|uniref:aldolase/citrate lyase family protein n=1 Tax=Amycolatopsis alkalitolerans TaxID=2547244 RepID=UPI00190F88B0